VSNRSKEFLFDQHHSHVLTIRGDSYRLRALPAQRATAEAALAEAQVDLDKTVVRAGVSGRVEAIRA
jgi:multidrug resistance efflux pump